jgi:hypothetical protein
MTSAKKFQRDGQRGLIIRSLGGILCEMIDQGDKPFSFTEQPVSTPVAPQVPAVFEVSTPEAPITLVPERFSQPEPVREPEPTIEPETRIQADGFTEREAFTVTPDEVGSLDAVFSSAEQTKVPVRTETVMGDQGGSGETARRRGRPPRHG